LAFGGAHGPFAISYFANNERLKHQDSIPLPVVPAAPPQKIFIYKDISHIYYIFRKFIIVFILYRLTNLIVKDFLRAPDY